jgi:hypothetical protein
MYFFLCIAKQARNKIPPGGLVNLFQLGGETGKGNIVYFDLCQAPKTISLQLIEPNSKQEAVYLKVQYQKLIKELSL